uniref:HTH OST-type domain-containing protein n=1 Tax=Trichuris muris TaxID=70415 RepID=A0A5S6QGQ6_TRIMR
MDESGFSWRQLTKSLLSEVANYAGTEEKLGEGLLSALSCHFGRSVLLDAFRLIDAKAVRRHVSPSGKVLFERSKNGKVTFTFLPAQTTVPAQRFEKKL